MTLRELLETIRALFTDQLRLQIESRQDDPALHVIPEPTLRLANGAIVREGRLQLPMRIDLMTRSGQEVIDSLEFTTDQMVGFDPIAVDWAEGYRVRIGPFQWENCPVVVRGVSPETDWRPLIGWFEKWFDEEEWRPPLEEDLQGVVHFLSDPQPGAGTAQLKVDFGTVVTDAFEELLDAIEETGAREVCVGQVEETRNQKPET